MGSRFLKSSRHLTSWLLVLWMGLITLGPTLHDGVGHDEDFAPAFVHHDPSHHRIDSAPFPPIGAENHCVACHLFCGSRHIASPSIAVHAAIRLSYATLAADDGLLIAASIDPVPARSPPAYS